MIIQCHGCSARYFLPESRVPSKPVKVKCPKCDNVFRLVPPPPEEKHVAPPEPEVIVSPSQNHQSPVEEGKAALTAPGQKPGRGGKNSKEERAKRLARVLVSDILWYNREKRDRALVEGNLMAVLGEEIKKSWELYKEKVGPEIASSTSYFKEALNEILADGQEIF